MSFSLSYTFRFVPLTAVSWAWTNKYSRTFEYSLSAIRCVSLGFLEEMMAVQKLEGEAGGESTRNVFSFSVLHKFSNVWGCWKSSSSLKRVRIYHSSRYHFLSRSRSSWRDLQGNIRYNTWDVLALSDNGLELPIFLNISRWTPLSLGWVCLAFWKCPLTLLDQQSLEWTLVYLLSLFGGSPVHEHQEHRPLFIFIAAGLMSSIDSLLSTSYGIRKVIQFSSSTWVQVG